MCLRGTATVRAQRSWRRSRSKQTPAKWRWMPSQWCWDQPWSRVPKGDPCPHPSRRWIQQGNPHAWAYLYRCRLELSLAGRNIQERLSRIGVRLEGCWWRDALTPQLPLPWWTWPDMRRHSWGAVEQVVRWKEIHGQPMIWNDNRTSLGDIFVHFIKFCVTVNNTHNAQYQRIPKNTDINVTSCHFGNPNLEVLVAVIIKQNMKKYDFTHLV